MPGSAPSTGRDLHVDRPLSNLVIARRPEGFIADRILPVTPVSKQSDLFYKYDHLESRRYEANLTARAPGTESRKVHFTVSSDNYFAKNYALGTDWPVEDIVNADEILAWAETNVMFLQDRIMFDYERRVADLVHTNVHTTTNVATAWSNRTGSRPYDDLNDILEGFRLATGVKANKIIIPEAVMSDLRANDQFRDLLFGDSGGLVTAQQIAGLLDIAEVLVPTAQINTFAETETLNGSASMADVWGDRVILAHINLAAGKFTDTYMNAFRWTNPSFGVPFAVKRFPFDEKKKIFSMEVEYYQDEKIISGDLGWRIDSLQ